MPIITVGRFGLDVTLKTHTSPDGLTGFLLVNGPTAGPKRGASNATAWPDGATPSEWFEFHRQEDAMLQAAGVPAQLRKHPDLWSFAKGDPAREQARLRIVERRPELGAYPYTAFM